MPLTWWTCRYAFYVSFGLSETTNWGCFKDGDGDNCSSNGDILPNLDQEESLLNHKPVPLQSWVILEDLAHTEATISQIRDYSFNHKKIQWSKDELESFFDLAQETWTLDDPQLHLSFQIYLSLSAHFSESTYESIRSSIKGCYSMNTMLSFDQVRNWLKKITGILPLHFNMCLNTCLAYTGIFDTLTLCPFCGECWYEQHHDTEEPKIARCQFITLPIGPQLQALWQHSISVAKLQDCLRQTTNLLAQRKPMVVFKITTTFAVVQNTSILLNLARSLQMTWFLSSLWTVHNFIGTRSRTHGLVLQRLSTFPLKSAMRERWFSLLLWLEVRMLPKTMTPFSFQRLLISLLAKALVY